MAEHELRYDGWALKLTDDDAQDLRQAIQDAAEGPYVLDTTLSGDRRLVLPLGGGIAAAVLTVPSKDRTVRVLR